MPREWGGRTRRVRFWVTPDYLAVGSEDDAFLVPLSPQTAQRMADLVGASLPTPPMVDAIWAAARVRLAPAPLPPSPAMTTVPVFEEHNRRVRAQRSADGAPSGALVAGHKKDVVLTARLDTARGKVAIYGWHRLEGTPIQPLYTGHTDRWVDYSHGIRLVNRGIEVDGVPRDLTDVLRDSTLAGLLSDEGRIREPRYPLGGRGPAAAAGHAALPGVTSPQEAGTSGVSISATAASTSACVSSCRWSLPAKKSWYADMSKWPCPQRLNRMVRGVPSSFAFRASRIALAMP
jgi:hypothetical protein